MMNKTLTNALMHASAAGMLFAALAYAPAYAQTTDISSSPLSGAASASVLPNLMFILDDSGSMGWDFLPDFVDDSASCKDSTGCRAGDPPYYAAQFNTVFYNPQTTYAPAVTFDGASMGNMGSPWTSVNNDVFNSSSGNTNLVSAFPERRYCDGSGNCRRNGIDTGNPFEFRVGSPDLGYSVGFPETGAYQFATGNMTIRPTCSGTVPWVCKSSSTVTMELSFNHNLRTGDRIEVENCSSSWDSGNNWRTVTRISNTRFSYSNGTSSGTGDQTCTIIRDEYDNSSAFNSNPHYYTITAKEYCSDATLINCVASTVPTGANVFPAYVRYCKNSTDANAGGVISGNSGLPATPRCRSKYDGQSTVKYENPRYGLFTRTDIVPATPTYGGRPLRTDCAAAPECTYTEEMTNFANWWAYYRTRMQMMKSSAGRAFLPIDDRYRVGFITINPGSPVSSDQYLKIDDFTPSHKEAWYKKFYQQDTGGGTPLRQALARAGWIFADKLGSGSSDSNNLTRGIPSADDPMQYSCQQNFSILTSDGYWNGAEGRTIEGSLGGSIGNQDNVNSGYSTRASGAFDGNLSGASNSLADVAMYYYKTDLRPAGSIGSLGADVSRDNVPTSTKDSAAHQHMTTFTLGLVDGLMTYREDYESALTGDFAKIKVGTSGACSWTTGRCDWPVPASNQESALDDLWHAAVNGRGTFYQANDPNSVARGLGNALTGLNIRTAAAAASATSSPNITPTDRAIFSSTYTTVEWSGEVVAQNIDPSNGAVLPEIVWSAQQLLDAKVTANSDTRVIHMLDGLAANKLKPFLFTGMTAAEQVFFANKCEPASNLSQCSTLSAPQLLMANGGKNMVNYLRGQSEHEATLYRDRAHVLGDTVNATPAYMRIPTFGFADAVSPDYASFKIANASRQSTLFIAANDGMLHAFNGDTGQEMWAYVPRIVMPNIYKLAEQNYGAKHQYFVDGSPALMDVYFGGSWKTILVGGFNSGGRGYYALDVTDPTSPKGLWEVCSDALLCSSADADMGLTFGNPVITKRPKDGKWVVLVTSGYNNVSPGSGEGFLYVLDAATGAILEKVGTGTGSIAQPSGLGKISAWADNGNIDNTAKYVYGGDILGNIWRFDLTTSPTSVLQLGVLTDDDGRPQSVTTRPELASIQGYRVAFFGTGRYLGVSDLQNPATWTPASSDAYQQSIYAIKDSDVNYGKVRFDANLVEQSLKVVSETVRTTTTESVDWSGNNGWYMDFNPDNDSPGERVSIDPQLVLGTLLVTTNVPNNDACTVGGESWGYQLNYESGQFLKTSQYETAGTKLGNAITVGVVVVRLPDGQLKAIATDAAGDKGSFGVNIGGTAASGKRTSWREILR